MNAPFGLADHWLWMMAAALFAIGEMVIPGVFLIWIAAAALLTGIVALLLPIGVVPQFLLFAIAAVAAIYVGRRWLQSNPITTPDPLMNDRGGRLVGSIVTAVEPVDALAGRVKVGDGVWSARGADAAVGDRLRVTGCEGAVLVVERV